MCAVVGVGSATDDAVATGASVGVSCCIQLALSRGRGGYGEWLLCSGCRHPGEDLSTITVLFCNPQGGDDDDDDISLAYERVRLRDPTALTKIMWPGRGSCCRHLQCFDLGVHVAEAYRKRAHQAQIGGPDRDATNVLTLIVCPISACALEIDVSQLIRDEFFASVIQALGDPRYSEVEFVDVDTASGAWRPVREVTAPPRQSHRKLAVAPPGGGIGGRKVTALRPQGRKSAESLAQVKNEPQPGAPTFYDLT